MAAVGVRSTLCNLHQRGLATLARPAVLGRSPALLRLAPSLRRTRQRSFKNGGLGVTMSNLTPLLDHEPEGYLNQVAYALPILARDPVVTTGFVLAAVVTSKCFMLAMTVPGPFGGKGLQIAAAALGGCIPVLFGLLASLRFPQPTQAERAIRRVKGLKRKGFVDAAVWDLIFEKVLDEDKYYVNLHFGAENDKDFCDKAVQRLRKEGLLTD